MELRIKMHMDNAAFDDPAGVGVAVLLRRLANQLDGGRLKDGDEIVLRDFNGNRVGLMAVIGS